MNLAEPLIRHDKTVPHLSLALATAMENTFEVPRLSLQDSVLVVSGSAIWLLPICSV